MTRSFYFKLFSILLISLTGILAYSNSFHCSFHLDDSYSIVDNTALRNLHDLQSIWSFWPCRFITYFTVALNYYFNGLNVSGYHCFNLAVHLITAILIWWLTLLTLSTPAMKKNKITGQADLIALLAALIFVSHPIQTQAVTYIVQRAACMAALFYIATLCFYIKSRLEQKSVRHLYYAIALLSAVAAMFTKETTITLPLMILLYEFYFLKTGKGLDWKTLSPFLLTALIIPLTVLVTRSFNFQHMQRVGESVTNISSVQYLLTEFRVLTTYIRLIFLPFNQTADYDYRISQNLFEFPVLLSLSFLGVILFCAKQLFSKYRLLSFSIIWFFLTLLPESSIFPIKDVIFEHRLYLPLAGFSIFLASGVFYLPKENLVKAMAAALLVLIACNSLLTYQRNKVWQDEFTLWNDTVQKCPHKSRPYNNRGQAYLAQNNFALAASDFDRAIELDPTNAEAYNNRGIIDNKKGNPARCISDFSKAIELNPVLVDAYKNRGLANYREGQLAQAISDFNKDIKMSPQNDTAYTARGVIYGRLGNFTAALSDLNQAIAINPNNAEAYYNRGILYDKQGNAQQAQADYNKAIGLNPHYSSDHKRSPHPVPKAVVLPTEDAQTYYNRAMAFIGQGDFSQALPDLDRAIKIKPDYAEAYNNRGGIYYNQGNLAAAMADYNMALQIDPDHVQAYNNRGNIYDKQGNFTQAIADFNKAIELRPAYVEAYYNRGNSYYHQNDFPAAIADYTKAVSLNPEHTGAYYDRALCYYQLKKYAAAWEDVLKIKTLGASVNPAFINALKEASGKDQ